MKVLMLSLLLFTIVLPVAAFAQKANTVGELVSMYDVNSCRECHSEIYDEWETSLHARSLVGTGPTMGALKGYVGSALMKKFPGAGVKDVKDIKVEHFTACFKCHLPQIENASDAVAQELAQAFLDGDRAKLESVNINCLVCHNLKAIVHKWQDGEPEKGVVYGSKDSSHEDKIYKTLKKSLIMDKAVLCGQCHGLGPNFEVPQPSQCATLYGSYLHSYIPSGGTETCQECHMKKSGRGHMMPAYRDPDMVKMAVDVDVQTKGYKFLRKPGELIPMATVMVKMNNHAGHRIPDG
jgi:nitrate/TMAO reductase-like tetraheme cytochrome c subunit